MNTLRDESPPPPILHATLRKVTERLAAELDSPTRTGPDWSEFDWIIARAVSAMHGISPLLSRTLLWQGPAGWMNFLEEQRLHTASRHARIEELLRRLDRRSREAGIAAVALKGAALHAIGLYAAGERPMADVDLLVRPQDSARMAQLLESLGYCESYQSWKERAFSPIDGRPAGELGEHSHNDIKIELHDRICEMLPRRITDVSEIIFPSGSHFGLNAYPSKAALMIHLLLHAAGAMASKAIRLLQLHDLAQLCSRMTAADWDELLEYGSRGRRLWWALPPLQLTSRYYSSKVPARILVALKADCPWLLDHVSGRRTLSDVSYSHLWIEAFPGIEWSQSIPEMLRFALARFRPSTQHIAMRVTITKTQAWASGNQWASLSQGRRMLRWIVSGQARPVTMHAVRAALAQAR
jgi:hypothetical protein